MLHAAMQPSRGHELMAAGAVAATGFGQTAVRIRQIHRAVANRAFRATGSVGMPAKLAHDAISASVYTAVGGVGSGLARAGGTALALAHMDNPRLLADSPVGAPALGALNGAFGDALEREANPLAVRMAVRENGRAVRMDSVEVARAFPDASRRVAIFTHGLCETEASWRLGAERHYGGPGIWHGSRLKADLGFTPVTVRVNTGLHVSENGRRLCALLEQLHACWPQPIEEILLAGHSMGGLINRSACHYGTEASLDWVERVRNVVMLGPRTSGRPSSRLLLGRAWPCAGRRSRARWPRPSPSAAWGSRTCAGGRSWTRTGRTATPTPGARTRAVTSLCSRPRPTT